MEYKINDFLIYPNGTIFRIVEFRMRNINTVLIKVRAVNSCKGIESSYERIGYPYTYQFWTSIRKLNKAKVKRIGTEEMLKALFKYKYGDRRCLK